jgi:uncharacterized repeat protein (TIGR01451 family)
MTHRSTTPHWLRLATIALAVAVLCSCRVSMPVYRMADAGNAGGSAEVTGEFDAEFDAELPEAAFDRALAADVHVDDAPTTAPRAAKPRVDRQIQLAAAQQEIPTHLTADQLSQARALPADFHAAPCGPGGCPCCSPGVDGHIRGPNDEYLCDGGDAQLPAAVVKSGAVVGLEPEDAVAHYDTIDGRTIITPSNKLCIYAPRFAAVRQVVDPRAFADIDAPEGAIRDVAPVKIKERDRVGTSLAAIEPNIDRVEAPPGLLRNRDQAGELDRERRVAITIGALAPYCNVQVVRTGEFVGRDVVKIARASLAAITWAGNQAAQVLLDSRKAQAEVGVQTPGTIYLLVEPNNPKLRLIKLASTNQAKPGEEVEFTLRFDNVGDRVIGNVTIIDSLTTRLEYVEGSQKSSLKANFTTHPNDGDSLTVRWEIEEPLEPGQGGVIQFRTRVR